MKRFFAFFCAVVLFLTSFPAVAVFATETDLVATDADLVEVKPEERELFPDLTPKKKMFKSSQLPMEDTLPDGFMEYLLEHFGNCEASFSIEQFNIPYSRWGELQTVILHETPELFHIYALGCRYYKSTDLIVDISANYLSYADTAAEYDSCLNKMRSGAGYLLQGVKNNDALTDVEKALILHDRLAVWTEYDVEGANTTSTYSKIHGAYSALGEASSVCQGYAMAYMYLLEQAGIESDYCSSDVLNHGWNIVYIDGTPYHVDVTWDDPITSNATYNDVYGRVNHKNFLLSSDGIWSTGHEASDYNTTPTDTRYDSEGATTWWKDSVTAVQLIDNNLYYLDKSNGKVICADDSSTVHTLADNSSAYRLSSAEGMLLCSTYYDVRTIDPKTGLSSVFYTVPGGYMEGMKYQEGKLWVQLNDGNGNSRRESMDYVAPELTEYTYTVENGEVTITGHTGTGGDVIIPDTLGGYPVTQIGENAFNNCTTLTSVTIPDSVTTIGSYAFHWCESLTSVMIPDSVTTIGDAAFNGCDRLASVAIGNSVTTIGNDAFRGCPCLTSLTIPDSVTFIGESAFSNCTALTSVTIPSKVTTISNYLFYYCPNLNAVTLPATLVAVGRDAFGECSKLTDVYYNGTENQWQSISVDTGNDCLQNATVHFPELEKTDYTYTIENGEATITGYTGAGGDVIIPDTLGGYPVTKVGEWAFASCTTVTSVTSPDSVTVIGEGAFYGCSYLNGVVIPDSVTQIGVDAFAGCIRLTSITIPGSVTAIYEGTFYYCESLTTVTIPDSVTYVGEGAFDNCNITKLIVAEGSKTITEIMVVGKGTLKEVVIPSSVTKIGEWALYSCDKLTTVNIPDSVTVIGEGAFYGCSSLASITIPDSVTKIGVDAFAGCIHLTAITIPNSVTAIYEGTFYYCESLTSVTIPDSVSYIGENAFANCTKLTDVYYNGTEEQWKSISVETGNEPLQNATIHFATAPEVPEVTDYTYTVENGEATVTSYTGAGGDITIPSALGGYPVTSISGCAFEKCNALISVSIPDSIVSIGSAAFNSCNNLTLVTMGENVSIIGSGAFMFCTSLKTIEIPNSVTKISVCTFEGCTALKNITIPHSITSIGPLVFSDCSSLTDVYYTGTEVQWNVIDIDSDNAELLNATIHFAKEPEVPEVTDYAYTVEDGKATITGYDGVGGDITIPSALGDYPVTAIGDYSFSNCDCLTSVTIPDSVTIIGYSVFDSCDSLTSVTIGDGVTTIGEYAFCCCTNLTSVTIPNGVTTIGNSVFSSCTSLTSVTIPDSITTIGEYAFSSCTSLTSVMIPVGVTTIGEYAFFGCDSLTSVTIPDSMTTISNGVFCACNGLTSVIIPERVTVIGDGAFDGCNSLTDVYYGGSEAQWQSVYVGDENDYLQNATIHFAKHSHNYTEKIVLPTCTDGGYTTYTCTCGDSYQDNYVNALDHSFTNYVSNNDATCVSDGTETAKCDRCEETHTRVEEGTVKGHDCEAVASAPTCLDGGFTTYICRRCDYAYVDDWVDALGHSYTNACDTTCNRSGCGATRKITHNYAAATCTKPKTCKVCKATSGKALGHSYKSGSCTRCKYKPAGAKITTQPVNVAVGSGKTARVTVKATGTGLKYTWYYAKKGAKTYTKTNVTTNSYSVKMSNSVNGGKVYCVVTDQYGNSVKSNVVTLYKGTAVKITTQPKSTTVANGKSGSITLKASGSSLKYQWYIKYKGASSFTKVGKSSKTYSFKMSSKLNGAQVYCVVKDKYGIEVKSSTVTIKMPVQPKITTQPKSNKAFSGKTVKFTVKASGEGLKYQWYYAKKGSNSFKKLSAKSATYSVKVSSSVNGRKYFCLVTDKYGQTVKTSVVTLTMQQAAKITTQPKNVSVKNGKTAKLTIKATGDGLKYTWYYLLPGAAKYQKASATGNTFSVKMSAKYKNTKVYCVIADQYGNSVKSKTVTLKMK